MPRGNRGSAFNRKGFDPTGMYDYKPGNFNYSGFINNFTIFQRNV